MVTCRSLTICLLPLRMYLENAFARFLATMNLVNWFRIRRWIWKSMFPPSSRLRIRCCCRRDLFQKSAVITIAQTFRTGTNDIDALDYVFMYLNDEKQSHSELHQFNDVYVLDNFRPVVTNKNWRIDLRCCRV